MITAGFTAFGLSRVRHVAVYMIFSIQLVRSSLIRPQSSWSQYAKTIPFISIQAGAYYSNQP
jgi:hypothetical protein